MNKIFIEIQTPEEISKKHIEILTDKILENAGTGVAVISIKKDIKELPELALNVKEETNGNK